MRCAPGIRQLEGSWFLLDRGRKEHQQKNPEPGWFGTLEAVTVPLQIEDILVADAVFGRILAVAAFELFELLGGELLAGEFLEFSFGRLALYRGLLFHWT